MDMKALTGWKNATRKEIRNLVVDGTFDKDVIPEPDEPVIDIMETNKIKLDRHGNLDKLKVRMCVRGDIQNKLTPDMEDSHSPAAAFRMIRMFMGLAAQKGSSVHQDDIVGAFIQAKMHSRVLVILNKYYGVAFPEFADYCGKPLLLRKAMYGMTLSGQYWYQACRDWLKSVGFTECPTC